MIDFFTLQEADHVSGRYAKHLMPNLYGVMPRKHKVCADQVLALKKGGNSGSICAATADFPFFGARPDIRAARIRKSKIIYLNFYF